MAGRHAGASTIVISVILFALAPIWGQKRPEPSPPNDLTILGFTLEKNTLADVEKRLGPSKPGRCSEEVEASKVICYAADGPGGVKVFFESGPSGGWSRLDGFRVALDAAAACDLRCKSTAAFGRDIQTNGGLKLGLTSAQLVALLGNPVRISGNRVTFEWRSRRRMTKAEIDKETRTFKAPVTSPYWDVYDTVKVTLNRSKVTAFEIHRTVTY